VRGAVARVDAIGRVQSIDQTFRQITNWVRH